MGFMLYGVFGIGVSLVIGHWLLPDSLVMWFASQDAGMAFGRWLILLGLAVMATVRLYYDNRLVRTVWLLPGVGLVGLSYLYFMNNPAFVFDALYMALAGFCFLVAAIQTTQESVWPVAPLVYAWLHRFIMASVVESGLAVRRILLSTNGTQILIRRRDIQQAGHRLIIGPVLQV